MFKNYLSLIAANTSGSSYLLDILEKLHPPKLKCEWICSLQPSEIAAAAESPTTDDCSCAF